MLTKRHINAVSDEASRTVLDARLDFGWLKKGEVPNTGCWQFVDGAHKIKVSEVCDENCTKSKTDLATYAKEIFRHEKKHAELTERDFGKCIAELKANKIPWRLFNLFEDARIEFRARRDEVRKFNWQRWEDKSVPSDPVGGFFCLIHNEPTFDLASFTFSTVIRPEYIASRFRHRMSKTKGALGALRAIKAATDRRTALVIWTFYVEVVRCATSLELVPLMKRWMEVFPMTTNALISSATDGTHAAGDIVQVEAAGDGEPAGETGPVPPEHTHNYGDMTGAEFAVVKPREYAQGLKLATILARAFRTNGGDKVNTAAPSKRLSLRNIAAGKMEKPYRRVEKVEKGIPTVSVIMDGSSSMEISGADSHARVMLYALNKLACDGVIKCNATLTVAFGVGGQCQMPCSPAKMAWRSISGSEGFSKTFTKKMSEFAKSDIVIALTDGCLGEDKPDFRALHSRGVYVVGAYSTPHAGDPKYLAAYASVLRAHFDRFVIRKTPEDTADAVARLIASRR